ncbi:MAG: tRNA (adenosine(37)-N6)-threonylcarbamoyltransferase complex transferase subunit TsaD [Pseudomonadota bacterium]
MDRELTLLGIETSCDETAAAIVRRPVSGPGVVLSTRVLSQLEDHAPYGGVVPELAARAHVLHLDRLIGEVMDEAGLAFSDLDGVAATAGPGLIGGLLVGLTTAKALCWTHSLPLLAINHLEGHALTPRLTDGLEFPYLLFLASGGHTQLLSVEAPDRYVRLGTTIDDALGEAFDKVAKLLGLGYPGGPLVERAAGTGMADRFSLPRPLMGDSSCNFSFSGLKTAVRRTAQSLEPVSDSDVSDICAGFQAAVMEVVADRCGRAMAVFRQKHPGADATLVVAGGVAANTALAGVLHDLTQADGFKLIVPPQWLCTDNAAMIAWVGAERLAMGQQCALGVSARARWPLDRTSEPVLGSGKAGAKV